MDLENEKKKKAIQLRKFLAERSFIPSTTLSKGILPTPPQHPPPPILLDDAGSHYVTAMCPPLNNNNVGGGNNDSVDCYYYEDDNGYHCLEKGGIVIPTNPTVAASASYDEVDYSSFLSPTSNCGMIDPGLDVEELFAQSLGFVCEEAVLEKKQNNCTDNGRFGLTLIYRVNPVDPRFSDVFVSEIEPNSPASEAQGLRLGDQVLQVNHQDVYSRDQVVRLFSESIDRIHLLLARSASTQLKLMAAAASTKHCISQKSIDSNQDMSHNSAVSSVSYNDPYSLVGIQEALDYYDTLEINQPQPDADSGMGRITDDNNAENSQTLSSNDNNPPQMFPSSQFDSQPPLPSHGTSDDFIDLDVIKINKELERLRQQCIKLEQMKASKMFDPNSTTSKSVSATTNMPTTPVKPTPRMGTRIPPRNNFNTNTMNSIQLDNNSSAQPQSNMYTTAAAAPTSSSSSSATTTAILRFSDKKQPDNQPQLQLHLQQSSQTQQKESNKQKLQQSQPTSSSHMHWVVKKRPDGSKYLVKRPISRQQLLKERAKQYAIDRNCGGLSTSDDEDNLQQQRILLRNTRNRKHHRNDDDNNNNNNTQNNSNNNNDTNVRVMLTFV